MLWAFDIGSVEELRRRVGGGRRGVDGKGRGRGSGERDGDGDEEVEFERWVAGLTRGRKGNDMEERRRSARGGTEERAREERFAVVEPNATNERGKPR